MGAPQNSIAYRTPTLFVGHRRPRDGFPAVHPLMALQRRTLETDGFSASAASAPSGFLPGRLVSALPHPITGPEVIHAGIRGSSSERTRCHLHTAIGSFVHHTEARTIDGSLASGFGHSSAHWRAKRNGEEALRPTVVGSHGRHGVERVLLGSVSESVVRHAGCSVDVIRPLVENRR
jgi:universal stress protein family protein